ncbi:MAG: medium chain dehydrogenase/reductase family protein [Flavobacterium sp.]
MIHSKNEVDSTANENKRYTVKEVILPGIVKPDGLLIQNRLLDEPSTGQVIIKVEASGVSFAERAMIRDKYPGMPKFPFVPGYDLVGTVVAVGKEVDKVVLGKRFAVLTKTGGWSTYVLISADELLTVPEGLDSADVETFVVNGITAWQMLHRKANIKKGQTILVLGANGGVGSILTQLAVNAGVRVIGASSMQHHEALKKKGVIPIDYNDVNFSQTVRELAPEGIDAVFDNIGGESILRSFKLLKSGGRLVSYAIAYALNSNKSVVKSFLTLIIHLFWLNILPNTRKAVFYNVWSGRGSAKFKAEIQEDFAQLMHLLKKGFLKSEISARFPLEKINEAMELAESRTTYGKILIIP